VTGAAQDDALARLVGDAVVVRDAFEQLPMSLMVLTGPDHRLVGTNAAYRALSGRSDVVGVPYAEAFPGREGRDLGEMLDRVYATGQPETAREWRAPAGVASGPGSTPGNAGRGRDHDLGDETYADFRVLPRRDAGGTVTGLLVMATDVTERVAERREWRDAHLPAALPVLPRARIAARYLVPGREQAAGGDWFDAIPLADGRIALAVGDVVGHGAAASAAIGQLRAVLADLLTAEPDLGRVLERVNAFAARTPALRAATLALAVLDPADGAICYITCGHPSPLVVGTDGTARFLAGTGQAPLGTEPLDTEPLDTELLDTACPPRLASDLLAPGELVLLYSDGLIERPDRSIPQAMDDLAAVAAEAAADPTLTDGLSARPASGLGSAAERVCQLTVELLARTGYADDVTILAAQRLTEPVPALRLVLSGERASLTLARDAFAGWLSQLDATEEDREALHLALVEIVTNAIEHAYPKDKPGLVEIEATLGDDGTVECRVTDYGTWRRPDPADADRGHGLMVAGHVVDTMLVSHLQPPAGTVVALRHRLRRPAVFASGLPMAGHGAGTPDPAEPPFTAATSIQADGTARATVSGPVDINTADQLARRLLSASRGGTIPLIADLTGVTQLASAGVRALYQVKERLAAHAHDLTLITAPGSSAHVVLDLVHLSHRSRHGPARGGAGLGGGARGGPALGGAAS
jgi:serine phosphatase RsbU (regulator of sigma subunit)/anti-sigma regulatory factor (Ser/Thr protein kinase)/anti-anti-sigma regulatory factor